MIRTRDRWLVLVLAASVVVYGVALWGLELFPTPFAFDFQTNPICPSPVWPRVAASAIMAMCVIGFSLAHVLPSARFSQVWTRTVKRPGVLAFVLGGFSALQLLSLQADWKGCLGLDIGIPCLGALILVVLYFARPTTDSRPVLGIAIASALLHLGATTVASLETHINLAEASLISRIVMASFLAAQIAGAALPALFAFRPVRQKAIIFLQSTAVIPPGFHLGLLAAGVTAFAISQLAAPADWRLLTLVRSLSLLNLASIGLLLMVPRRSVSQSTPPKKEAHHWSHVMIGLILGIGLPCALLVSARAELYRIISDGYAYLTIARSYAEGVPLIRGHWSPLLSWLTAPVIALGLEPVPAARLVQGAASLAWILGSARLAAAWGLNRGWRLAVVAAMGGIAFIHAFHPLTPDLLSGVVLIPFFLLLTSPRLFDRPGFHGIALGALGALAYYAKQYDLMYGLALVFLTLMMRGRLVGRRTIAISFLVPSLLTLSLLILPWVTALTARYGFVTVSTSGIVGVALTGPKAPSSAPCIYSSLCVPPPDVLFPWEDPRPQDYATFSWSPLESVSSLRHQLILPLWSLQSLTKASNTTFGPLPILAILGQAIRTIAVPMSPGRFQPRNWAVLAILLFACGYFILGSSVIRYFFPMVPLALVLLFGFGQDFVRHLQGLANRSWGTLAPYFSVLISIGLLLSVVRTSDVSRLLAAEPSAACLAQAAQDLQPYLESPMAGVGEAAYFLAFYARKQSYGTLPVETPPRSIGRQFASLGIQTAFIPADSRTADVLREEFGYTEVARYRVCASEYVILRPRP